MRLQRRILVPAVVGSLLALNGCAQGGDERTVRHVSEEFYAAVAAKDGKRACALLGTDTRTQLEKQEAKPCDQAVLGLKLHGSKAQSEDVYLDGAVVKLAGGDTVFLGDDKEGWRISAAGCKPTAPDEPYDCEVES